RAQLLSISAAIVLSVAASQSATANEIATGAVTYAKDVAPILNAHCVVCHREGEVAPMSLRTYAEVRPWTKSILARAVQEKSMPPWHADPEYGKYANDARLSAAEIATIDK